MVMPSMRSIVWCMKKFITELIREKFNFYSQRVFDKIVETCNGFLTFWPPLILQYNIQNIIADFVVPGTISTQ